MEFFFYSSSLATIVFTVCSIFSRNLMYSLLYLILSFVFTSCVFFSLGATFAAALEVIIYAGAIMVLFVFFIMMFNFKKSTLYAEKIFDKNNYYYINFLFLLCILIFPFFFILSYLYKEKIFYMVVSTKLVAIKLFSDYILVIELSSIVLLSALIIVSHIGKIRR
ncbi:NADH dehydrogenase I chain J [Buchnera aphidicola str. Bp (Baizongia pistaciae)]|uniref:NADH-quinone oxidoreductase subunit J n=1 Tax=Buchnera aphidicola subsp. Baizongia pistaciae (strain Bp) TaxID=224915 RepID=NUOJ_BUCBP|nr:NADH-quinone oxidoreductase subunit J [Buchnera aphidicola]Q89AT8.1 RecName: Full=NADH-quinone oxidoreductase subunit J; AltName: Full=NADH dehydrogenase I subunit J; AltName: Full=NDH-1 subunit J [Buchnera aphidicola str. Bp (Baizongia pistaciae)]AAO26885.1 NADH dehydrogenase I chain J [Buchnera aphidicola str. Bp (Baizongia pistaciae)]